jgi:uncharacterized protein YndB with AHSA1/START domain
MENDFKPLVGVRCQLRMRPQPGFNGVIQCEVLEVQPPVCLVYTWGWRRRVGKDHTSLDT